jgi:hypothetical protein
VVSALTPRHPKKSRHSPRLSLICALLLFILAAGSSASFAQDADGIPDVADRYEGTGARLGSFWFLPTLDAGLFYDSNIYATSGNETGSLGSYIAPRLELESNWGRHALNLMLAADQFLYFDDSSINRTNVYASIDGQVDITRDFVFKAGASGGLYEQEIGNFNTVYDAAEPTRHTAFTGWSRFEKSFNRIVVSVGGSFDGMHYDDVESLEGINIDQSFRDGHVIAGDGRISYQVSEGSRVFADFSYNWQDYTGGMDDSDGWQALAGVEFDITHLLRGELGIGYMEQYFQTGGTEGGISYHAGLTWNPTPLMTVNLSADRAVESSAYADGSGVITDSATLTVDYEVLRGVVLSPSAAIQTGDYVGADYGDEMTYDLGLKLDYVMNRFVTLGAGYVYSYTDFEDPPPGVDNWDRHVVSAYAKARF